MPEQEMQRLPYTTETRNGVWMRKPGTAYAGKNRKENTSFPPNKERERAGRKGGCLPVPDGKPPGRPVFIFRKSERAGVGNGISGRPRSRYTSRGYTTRRS